MLTCKYVSIFGILTVVIIFVTGCDNGKHSTLSKDHTESQLSVSVTNQAGLTYKQANRLSTLGAPVPIPVAVPSSILKGFKVDSIYTTPSNVYDVYLEYFIRYETSYGKCFAIESKTGVAEAVHVQMGRQPELAEQYRHLVKPRLFLTQWDKFITFTILMLIR